MTQAPAHALLRALGRNLADGSLPDQGVFTIEQLPEVIENLQTLIENAKQQQQQARQEASASGKDPQEQQAGVIGMQQRAWPLLDQCRRSLAAEKPVTWRKT
jgi:Sec-independent protein translocase protein TatA